MEKKKLSNLFADTPLKRRFCMKMRERGMGEGLGSLGLWGFFEIGEQPDVVGIDAVKVQGIGPRFASRGFDFEGNGAVGVIDGEGQWGFSFLYAPIGVCHVKDGEI